MALFRTESDQRINCPIRTNTQRFCLARAVHCQPAPHHPGTRQEPIYLPDAPLSGRAALHRGPPQLDEANKKLHTVRYRDADLAPSEASHLSRVFKRFEASTSPDTTAFRYHSRAPARSPCASRRSPRSSSCLSSKSNNCRAGASEGCGSATVGKLPSAAATTGMSCSLGALAIGSLSTGSLSIEGSLGTAETEAAGG